MGRFSDIWWRRERQPTLARTGATDGGRKHLLEAARLDPDNASPYVDLGNSFLRDERTDQAGVMYRQALGRNPESHDALIGLAIALIRDQSRRPRDVQEALELATKACSLTDHKSPPALIVLADAYAAAGLWGEAVSVARKALDVAQRTGKPDLAATVRTLLEQYEQQMAPRRAP